MSPLSLTIVSASRAPLSEGRRESAAVRVVVARGQLAGAAEDQVGDVRPLVRRGQAEEVGVAADDVVLAEAAEDDVAATVALDVVLAVARAADRRVHRLRPGRDADQVDTGRARAAGAAPVGGDPAERVRWVDAAREARVVMRRARRRGAVVIHLVGDEVDRAVALDRVVAELAEDEVALWATGEVVVAEAAGPDVGVPTVGSASKRCQMFRTSYSAHHGTSVGSRKACAVPSVSSLPLLSAFTAGSPTHGVRQVGAAVEQGAAERLEAQAGRVVVGAAERDVVAEDQIVLDPAVDSVVAGTADQDVAVGVAVDPVVAGVLERLRVDVQDTLRAQRLGAAGDRSTEAVVQLRRRIAEDRGRERLRLDRHGLRDVARARDVLGDDAEVAEDDVVVVAERVDRGRRRAARALAVEQVVAGNEMVEVDELRRVVARGAGSLDRDVSSRVIRSTLKPESP